MIYIRGGNGNPKNYDIELVKKFQDMLDKEKENNSDKEISDRKRIKK